MPRWWDKSSKDDRPEGYYVDSGTYPVLPKSLPVSTDDLYDVLTGITPELHGVTIEQFGDVPQTWR